MTESYVQLSVETAPGAAERTLSGDVTHNCDTTILVKLKTFKGTVPMSMEIPGLY